MASIWSDEGKLSTWLAVEQAATAAWAELGVVPDDAAAVIGAATPPTPERVAEIEATLHHDTAAFVDAVGEQLDGEGRRWLHYGLTSSDIVDTALSLQIREAGKLILAGIDGAFAAVVARAEEHRETLQIGRTHGVHAEPTTFGLKLAGWAFELARNRERVARALEGLRVGKLSGAVGTYSATDPELERIACERLGLEPAPSSTQILQRDRHAELMTALAVLASSLDAFALEIRHLARTEVAEVQEPFGKGQKGSSAMPHKRNPVVAERICGLARVVRANALVGLENVALWHERDISHSSAERVVIPDGFLALDYMLDRFTWLVDGLVVRTERMRRNLESSHSLFFSQRILLALVESGLERDDAYRLVQRNAMRAWDAGSPGSPVSGSRFSAGSFRITCSRFARTGGRWSATSSRCSRSSASCADTSPARAGRTTRRRARRAGTRFPRDCTSRTSCRSRSSRRRRRRRPVTTRTSRATRPPISSAR